MLEGCVCLLVEVAVFFFFVDVITLGFFGGGSNLGIVMF